MTFTHFHGNAALNSETNAVIHSAVLEYIKDTHRFMKSTHIG